MKRGRIRGINFVNKHSPSSDVFRSLFLCTFNNRNHYYNEPAERRPFQYYTVEYSKL